MLNMAVWSIDSYNLLFFAETNKPDIKNVINYNKNQVQQTDGLNSGVKINKMTY